MFACFHSLGSLPVVRDVLKIVDSSLLIHLKPWGECHQVQVI